MHHSRTVFQAAQQADVSLYWEKKLRRPLEEIFRAALPPSQHALLQEVFAGDHTRVRQAALASPPPAPLAPASPPPAGLRGSGGEACPRMLPAANTGQGHASAARCSLTSHPPTALYRRAHCPALPLLLHAGPAAGRQAGMSHFFRPVPKCLGCRLSLSGFRGDADDAPGLCAACAG